MNQPVTIYTLPGCMQCNVTKRALDNAEITYVIVDLASNKQAVNMVKQLGFTAAPVVAPGNTAWSGFRPDKIEAMAAARAEESASCPTRAPLPLRSC